MKTPLLDEQENVGQAPERTGQPVLRTGLYHCCQCETVNLRLLEGSMFPKCGRCMTHVRWVLCPE